MTYKTRGWKHPYQHHNARGFGFFWPLMIVFFLMLLTKGAWFWPVFFVFFIIMMVNRHGRGVCQPFGHEKRKNGFLDDDEKRKNDDYREPRYVQTEDGDWVEIV
jgi:hypothetical protein